MPFEIRADGWLARIFQHEFDHLDGVLYVDRLEHPFGKAAAKASAQATAGAFPASAGCPVVDHLED